LLAKSDSGREVLQLHDIDFQFSDSETCVRLDFDVSGYDLFLFQALYDPLTSRSVDQNYLAFLLAARTFREWGANNVTAVLPYLAYARQDKPTKFEREPTSAKLMADLSLEAGIDRLVVWHPHYNQVQGFYGKTPVLALEAVSFFVEAFKQFEGREDVVVVAPDLGASKFITYFSRTLNLRSALASKYRPEPEKSRVTDIVGDFSNKRVAVVLDDMISSGGTVYALIKKLVQEKGVQELYLGASHNLCTTQAQERLMDLHENYHLKKVIVTDSIPQTEEFRTLPFVSVRSLSDILTRVINGIHYNQPVTGLTYQPVYQDELDQ
jgi:ribose-phosphate pyrophosphokinase